MSNEIITYINENLYGIWFLIGAALVFWMQAGFALVEAGFTRAKNAGNIIMKNLMDFCIGTVMFILIGCSLLLGEDLLGFIGKPGFDLFTAYGDFNYSSFVFNLVFCATTATIVSGAMAERTKFLSYCIYSAVISALIYPVEAHWIWGGGWLADMGFHDFAGSCAIHMVGGISALIGARILGPRIGKFSTRTGKPHAIPGHNLPVGALGVFILWLGWYGFNGAAATSLEDLGSIFLTTTIAPAIATVVCMIFTWIKYGKPDVSMCLNASLAGLVAITAPCDVTDGAGALVIGAVAGLLVVFHAMQQYVNGITVYPKVTVRTVIIGRLIAKLTRTSYPNLHEKQFKVLEEKAEEAVDSNAAATEGIWATLTKLLQNIMGFVIYMLLLSDLNAFLIGVVLLTAVLGYSANHAVNQYGYRHREEMASQRKQIGYIKSTAHDILYPCDGDGGYFSRDQGRR